jgi:hypothetical protein
MLPDELSEALALKLDQFEIVPALVNVAPEATVIVEPEAPLPGTVAPTATARLPPEFTVSVAAPLGKLIDPLTFTVPLVLSDGTPDPDATFNVPLTLTVPVELTVIDGLARAVARVWEGSTVSVPSTTRKRTVAAAVTVTVWPPRTVTVLAALVGARVAALHVVHGEAADSQVLVLPQGPLCTERKQSFAAEASTAVGMARVPMSSIACTATSQRVI